MPFLQTRPAEARTPEVEVLPDQRKRLTRFFRLTQTGEIPYGLTTLPGTPDPWPETAPVGFEGLLLTYKKLADNTVLYLTGGKDPTPWVELIYEQIHPTDETPVGAPVVVVNQYGYLEVTYEWVQFSSSPFVPQVVGTTAAAAPWAICILRDEEAPDDGTLRKIKRTYVEGGELSDVQELRFGGALTIRTLKYLNEVPPLLAGWTLVGPGVEYINGLPVYSYQYAKASGAGGGAGDGAEISRGYVNTQNGLDDFDPADPDGGTGAVVCTIEYVSTPAVTTDPTTGPAGYVRFAVEVKDEAGYRMWTVRYGFGSGLVLNEVTTSATGTLVTYHRVSLGTPPTAPAATLGGTVSLFDLSSKNSEGYVIYDYRWAEGQGEVSREFTNAQNGTTAFNPLSPNTGVGAVVCAIVFFTAPGITVDPTTGPAGFVRFAVDFKVDGGYKIWTVRYGFGSGLVLDEKTIQATDALIIYHRVALGAAPAAPAATIGGTVTVFETSSRNDNGHVVFDYRWAEGDGQTSIETQGDPDGAIVVRISTATAAASTPATPGGAYFLISLTQSADGGYSRNVATYKKPPVTVIFKKKMNFTKPGSAVIGGSPIQFVLNQQVTMTILADVEVSYGTAQLSDVPFTVQSWATYYETYTPTDTGIAVSKTESLGGYLAGASGNSGSGDFNGILCDSYSYQLGSSIPSSFTLNLKVLDVDNDPYLTDTAGVVVFRRTKVSYDFS